MAESAIFSSVTLSTSEDAITGIPLNKSGVVAKAVVFIKFLLFIYVKFYLLAVIYGIAF